MKGKQIITEFMLLAGVLAGLLFVFRFWIGVLIAFLGLIALTVAFFVLAVKQRHEQPIVQTAPPKETEEEAAEYFAVLNTVTKLVQSEHPNAKWVWAQPDTRQRLKTGEDVFILLNGAGGYKRAHVLFEDGNAVALEYCRKLQSNAAAVPEPTPVEGGMGEQPAKDYDLLAYEWVEAHIQTLNEQCNDALGQGKHELLLPAETLPTRASWVSICRELGRNDLCNTECVPEGIKINLA